MSVKSFKFVSPGVFINEIDNSFIPSTPDVIGPVVIGRPSLFGVFSSAIMKTPYPLKPRARSKSVFEIISTLHLFPKPDECVSVVKSLCKLPVQYNGRFLFSSSGTD